MKKIISKSLPILLLIGVIAIVFTLSIALSETQPANGMQKTVIRKTMSLQKQLVSFENGDIIPGVFMLFDEALIVMENLAISDSFEGARFNAGNEDLALYPISLFSSWIPELENEVGFMLLNPESCMVYYSTHIVTIHVPGDGININAIVGWQNIVESENRLVGYPTAFPGTFYVADIDYDQWGGQANFDNLFGAGVILVND